VNIFPEVRHEIDAQTAVQAELSSRNRLLPPLWGDLALIGHEAAVVDWFKSLIRRDFAVQQEDLLLARKLGRGARPLSLLGLQERLLYRGSVALVESTAGVSRGRNFEDYGIFQRAPLQIEGCRYVFKADIAAYYQYIDHERLVDEVVAQTGDDLAASVAVEVLRNATGRSYGLPQLNTSSDVLAEIYIEPMYRALLRSGFEAFRFADDFRVACRTYAEALGAWEAADGAARELGLVLNELKTSTRRADRYESDLTALHDQELQLFQDLDIEELEDVEYFGDDESDVTSLLDEEEFEEGDIANSSEETHITQEAPRHTQIVAARTVLESWRNDGTEAESRDENAQIGTALLRRSLQVLGNAKETDALPHVAPLLVYVPSLTPTIAKYLIQCSESSRRQVLGTLDEVLQSRVINAWQATWMAYVAGAMPRTGRVRRSTSNSNTNVEWLRAQTQSSSPALAAEAILALARRRLTSVEQVNVVLNRLTPVQRPTGIMALAVLGDEGMVRQAAPSAMDRIRVEWAGENL
jgi:hypothetical protein